MKFRVLLSFQNLCWLLNHFSVAAWFRLLGVSLISGFVTIPGAAFLLLVLLLVLFGSVSVKLSDIVHAERMRKLLALTYALLYGH